MPGTSEQVEMHSGPAKGLALAVWHKQHGDVSEIVQLEDHVECFAQLSAL